MKRTVLQAAGQPVRGDFEKEWKKWCDQLLDLQQLTFKRIGELYNIIHWSSAEQNKFKASNGHRLKRRDDPTAANSGTVEEIQG
ncbi:hypothetical protein MTO96_047434 [Rhipicephalus appendiculatus]